MGTRADWAARYQEALPSPPLPPAPQAPQAPQTPQTPPPPYGSACGKPYNGSPNHGSPSESFPSGAPLSLAPPAPARPLRPVRSATNLSGAHPRQQQHGFVDGQDGLPVDFVVDALPRQSSLSPQPEHEIRRAKSSSALSAAVSQDQQPKDQSKWKAALGEAQYFAGGLISHPAESTRHFTIIRHSHALVWYRGPATSVPITILSDEPLPPSRTVWLQQKGFSGNMGMTLKAMVGSTGSWINATPASKATLEHIQPNEERAIQRDLKRFYKKAGGKARKHVPRETHIVRIPAAATDGYFRLVMTENEESKKVLCGSPVFRIASTSTDISSVRGSSLSTMPLEFGVKVATTIGQQVVNKYTGVAGAVIEKGTKRIPRKAITKAARTAYTTSGLGDAVNESWKNGKAGRYDPISGGPVPEGPLEIIGPDTGPEPPFPLKFAGKVVRGTGISARELGIPTANLSEVPDEIKMRMSGVFAAWACIQPQPGLEEISGDWYEAIVTIAPLRNATPGVVPKTTVAIHIINDFEDVVFYDARLKVMLMGYLHPWAPEHSNETMIQEHGQDVMTTVASLGREAWAPQEARATLQMMKSEKTFSDRLNDVTGMVQNRVDRLPIHLAGVRSESSSMRDQVYGNGGLWIPR